VFPYNYFNARIQRAAQIIEKYATSFEILHEQHITTCQSCERDGHED